MAVPEGTVVQLAPVGEVRTVPIYPTATKVLRRNDDLIKASGYRISPTEVENALASHPAVLESAAVESPDQVRGNIVKAYVVLRSGYVPSQELIKEIQEHVKREATPFKYPWKIEFVEALPKTQSGKLNGRNCGQPSLAGSLQARSQRVLSN